MPRLIAAKAIVTERFLLREPVAADLASLLAIFADPATSQFHAAGPMSGLAAAEDVLWRWRIHWAQHGFGMWVVCDRHHPEDIFGFGGVAWRQFGESKRLNLGIRLRESAWGQGVATEVGEAALALAFDQLNASEVCAVVPMQHRAAHRVVAKLGLQSCGEHRDFPWSAACRLYRVEQAPILPARVVSQMAAVDGHQQTAMQPPVRQMALAA